MSERWERLRAELRAVVRLAAPVILVQVGQMLMGVVDTMMLGRVSELALAAGALGNSVAFGLVVLPMGMLMALDPLVAQAWGGGDRRRLGRIFQQGLILATVLTVPLSLAMWDTEGALAALGQKPELLAGSSSYLRAVVPGNLPFLLFVAVRQTLQAMSMVRPAVIAIVVGNVANVVANYALIFGHFGFPRLGVVGSGLSTSFSRWVMLAVLLAAAARQVRPHLQVRRSAWRLGGLAHLLRLGIPIGVQLSLEMWLFMAVALMMGAMGARELAGHQIALNLAAITYMVPLGVAGAAATRVGNAIGRGSQTDARRSAAVTLCVGAAVMSVSAAAFSLFPGFLARLFTPGPEVIATAALLIPIAGAFQIFDGLQVVAAGVLRGIADTRVPAFFALVGYWFLGLPLAWLLAFRTELGPRGLWWGLTLGLASAAVMLLGRVRSRFASAIDVVGETPG